jgi:ribonuclease HII
MSRGVGATQATLDWTRPGLTAGVDEAGRGPLAGPVVAAAVILDPSRPIAGLADSKALTPARRAGLAVEIRGQSLAWSLGWADAAEIDAINILQATMVAMRRALLSLSVRPAHVIVDGNRCPDLRGTELDCTMEAVVKGDALVASVSAASILAKVVRDEFMRELDGRYPGYGFADHKGYPTAAHVAALARLGPSPVHRRSFAPVQSVDPR